MTIKTGLLPLAIMAHRPVRAAGEAGAAVLVLSASLGEIVWGNTAGRKLLGLPAGVDFPDAASFGRSPIGRQIRTALRPLANTGAARVLVRAGAGLAARPAAAELSRIEVTDGPGGLVLLCVTGGRPLAGAVLAQGLLADTPARDGRSIVVMGSSGAAVAQTGGELGGDLDLAAAAAEFRDSASDIATIEARGRRVTLVRASTEFVIACVDIVETPASASAGLEEAAPGSAEAGEAKPGHADSIALDPSAEPAQRRAMNMNALLERWHRRQDGGAVHEAEDAGDALGGAVPPASPAPLDPAAAGSIEPDGEAAGAEPAAAATAGSGAAPEANGSEGLEELASPEADEATLSGGDGAVPSDGPGAPSSDEPQPIERVSVTTLPDRPGEEAGALDLPLSTDEEAPPAERVLPPPSPELPPEELAEAPHRGNDAAGSFPQTEAAPFAAPEASAPTAGLPPAADGRRSEARHPTGGNGAGFTPRFEIAPVRFVWQIDRHGAFRSLSPEFAAAVGPRAADIIGLSFEEVTRTFGLEGSAEIMRLLERRDTWSGRSLFWPVENSARKAPIDLAALPIYARDRSFDGFRGFGIVRMNEAVADADARGLSLPGRPAPSDADGQGDDPGGREQEEAEVEALPPAPAEADDADDATAPPTGMGTGRPVFRTFEPDLPGVVFGRRAEAPAPAGDNGQGDGSEEQPKVIRLEERRRPRDGALSQAEEAAFRAIGMKLGSNGEAESPAALGLADLAAPEEAAPPGDEAASASAGSIEEPEAQARSAGDEGPPVEAAGLEVTDEPASLAAAGVPAKNDAGAGAASAGDVDGEGAEAAVVEAAPAESLHEAQAMPAATEPPSAGASTQDAVPASGRAGDGAEEDAGGAPEAPSSDGRERGEDREPAGSDPSLADDLDKIFASLPLPVLVQASDELVYANREFAELTGYEAVDALRAAGGLEALIVEPGEGLSSGSGGMAVRRADGRTTAVRVHLQRVTFAARSCLLMSFAPVAAAGASVVPVSDPEADDLRQQVEELQAVLDTATDGVVLLDPAGNIRAMNGSAHALFGIGHSDAAGRHLSSLFALESQKATADYLETLRDDGLAGILNDGREVIGRVAQGGFIPLFITIGRLSGDRGWCVVIRDIARWKRIEEDLVNARRQAEAASLHKSRFLANISHELRTPLNAIIGFADVMASECFGPIGNERYIEYLGDIKRSGHHVLDLVNDLLDISKIEAGKLDLTFEAVSLNEVVSEVVSLMQPQANRERVIVRSNLPSSVPPVVADRRTMRQIALNLIANAIRFTPSGGQIIASTTYTAEGDVLLRFRDSGIGMTEREIEIALTPFQQVHAPSANRGEGTGLGLPLTKAMVEANRAHFAINSVPGEGTLVEISFPSQRVLAD